MGVPISQMWAVATYVLKQKLKGRKRYPLVLMLEPLFRCNLACAGCGKIQYPAHILKRQLSPEECFRAADECGAPVISIPGGEPLLHPQIEVIVEGFIQRRKYVYLCTNALVLKEKLNLFKPSKYLTFSVHLDGQREHHDQSVCREGGYDIAVEAIREALRRGFRVTTNTTLFEGADPRSVRAFFDEMTQLGVEGMMLSPGYSYSKAPDQQHFLGRQRTRELFRRILSNRNKSWRFNQSPLFLEFLMGLRHYACTPWGMPTYTIFGWQKPCYLLQDGYAETFAELIETTAWDNYGTESGNPRCANCMVHSGYEASAVHDTFSLRGIFAAAKASIFRAHRGPQNIDPLETTPTPTLVQLTTSTVKETTPAEPPSLQGWTPSLQSEQQLLEAIERAFDYRGDVTVTLKDGRRIEGYILDRRQTPSASGRLRLLPKDAQGKLTVPYTEIAQLEFTGKDTAAGKSYETWLRNQKSKTPPAPQP